MDKAVQICKASYIVKTQAQELHITPEGTLVNQEVYEAARSQAAAKQRSASQQDDAAGGRHDE